MAEPKVGVEEMVTLMNNGVRLQGWCRQINGEPHGTRTKETK